jgi:thioredoxin reductase
MQHRDIILIGAGPAGLTAGYPSSAVKPGQIYVN